MNYDIISFRSTKTIHFIEIMHIYMYVYMCKYIYIYVFDINEDLSNFYLSFKILSVNNCFISK
jgi:hypothetical protein